MTENSYRVTAEIISETCGQSISHGGVWKIVQQLGERVSEEEEHLVKEMDGVWLKLQGKDYKSIPKQEMKVATIYEGLDAEETKRSVLKGKKTIAGMESCQ